MKSIYARSKMEEDECLEAKILTRLIEYAQKQIEGRNFGVRKNVLQYDDVMNKQRMIMYAERMKVLKGENVHEQVVKFIPDFVESVVRGAVNADDMPEKWNEEDLNRALEQKLIPEGSNYVTREKLEKWEYDVAIKKISEKTRKCYEEKLENIKAETGIDYADVERRILLMNVDRNWIDHIDAMDQLRKGIGLRAYGQVDPIISYKQEGFAMFDEMIERIQTNTIAMLLKVRLEVRQQPVPRVMPTSGYTRPSAPDQGDKASVPVPAKEESVAPSVADVKPVVDVDSLKTNGSQKFNPASMPKKVKVGANDPCPCGSGLKYKKCHGKP